MRYKQKRKLILVSCDGCNTSFEKPISEYNRNKKQGRRNFCTRTCAGKNNITHLEKHQSVYIIAKHSNNRSDEFTPFRYYLKVAKQRFKECTILLQDLKYQWENQKGVCPYSGVHLVLKTHNATLVNPVNSASLDRIDSSLGYVVGNIQFVALPINYMKNTMTHQETLTFCKIIAKNFN